MTQVQEKSTWQLDLFQSPCSTLLVLDQLYSGSLVSPLPDLIMELFQCVFVNPLLGASVVLILVHAVLISSPLGGGATVDEELGIVMEEVTIS